MLRTLRTVLVVLPAWLLLSCAVAAAGKGSLDSLEHRRWLAADGGPSQLGAIVQASDGYLWLGTNASLVRFDGSRFMPLARTGAARGAPAIVAALLASGAGQPVGPPVVLWVGLRSGGVGVLRHDGALVRERGPGAPQGMVSGLARGRDGAVWAAGTDGLALAERGRWRRIGRDQGFGDGAAHAVHVDRDGAVWAAGAGRLYYLAAGAQRFADARLDVENAGQIAQAPDGAIWLTERYRGMVHRVRLQDGRVDAASVRLPVPATSLLFDRHGDLWLGTAGQGLRHVKRPTRVAALAAGASASASSSALALALASSMVSFTARQGLSSDFVLALHEDRDGNLWVGTNAGLDRFRERIVVPGALPAGALNAALAPGPDGSLWVGPGSGTALRLQAGQVQHLAMPAPANGAIVDAGGVVWMAGPAGVWRARGARLERVAGLPPAAAQGQAQAQAGAVVRAMARSTDAGGDLWVSINKVGLFRLHAGRWLRVPGSAARASQRMPVSALAAPDGWLWFGYRDGLLEARRGDTLLRWQAADGLDIGHVTALAQHAGRVWVGGERGLGYIEAGRYRRLPLPHPPSDPGLFANIYAIVPVAAPGGEADLWLHTRSGIFQLTAAELARAAADPRHRIRYRAFDALGGLANDPHQVLPLPTAVRGADGRLWFSTSGGVAWIDPARLPPESPGPAVEIEAVSVDGARVPLASRLVLGPEAQRIGFDYSALNLAAPERLGFRYRLDGYDADWLDAGRARHATYTGLAPGTYRFRVAAVSEDGMASAREAVFAFSVARAFHRHPAFVSSAALLASAALWWLYMATARRAAARMRDRLQERHRERERIARELHDTLLQGVNGLVLRFQAAADLLPPDAPVRERLEQALLRADQVLVEGRDRVRALRGGPRDARDLHAALQCLGDELAAELAAESSAQSCARSSAHSETAFALTVSGTVRDLLPASLDEIYRIGHEAIGNAFAHAGARRVRVDIAYHFASLSMTVADDGRGIDPAWLEGAGRPDHWGLRGMHERAERIGASLAIRRVAPHGTSVELVLPARMAYRRGKGN